MKRSIAILLLAFSSATVHAGSFGGPPPFSNGSPMVTGVDGSYQASARSTNVTGIFRFQYASGSQTSAADKNNWVFFIEGHLQRGTVDANINDSSLDGIFDTLNSGTNTNGSAGITLPWYIFSDSVSGNFQGKMNMDGSFKGQGQLVPQPEGTNTLTVIGTYVEVHGTGSNAWTVTYIGADYIPITNTPGTTPPTKFKFKGVKTSYSQASQ